jgi:hypothetical protein
MVRAGPPCAICAVPIKARVRLLLLLPLLHAVTWALALAPSAAQRIGGIVIWPGWAACAPRLEQARQEAMEGGDTPTVNVCDGCRVRAGNLSDAHAAEGRREREEARGGAAAPYWGWVTTAQLLSNVRSFPSWGE